MNTKPEATMDVVSLAGGNVSAVGDVASRLIASNFNVASLRTLGTLRKEEWLQMDTVVQEVARQRLVGVQEVLSRGLRYDIPNAMGTMRLDWERMGDFTDAEINMSGIVEAEQDRPVFDLVSLPLPIVHKDFSFNIRALEASRRNGTPLDTTAVGLATRKVVEKVESMLFNGATIASTNGTIYGLKNAPNKNTGTIITNGWDAVATTGADIIADCIEALDAMRADHMWGPYGIFVPLDAWGKLTDDYKANSDRTILERIMAIPGIAFVMPSEYVATNTALFVQMSSDVVQMVVGFEPTLVEWDSHGGMVKNFKVMTIMVPRVRSDYLNQSGVTLLS